MWEEGPQRCEGESKDQSRLSRHLSELWGCQLSIFSSILNRNLNHTGCLIKKNMDL